MGEAEWVEAATATLQARYPDALLTDHENYVIAALYPLVADKDAEIKALRDRVTALDSLLVCYRLGKSPSERLHRELERTRRALAATDTTGGAT